MSSYLSNPLQPEVRAGQPSLRDSRWSVVALLFSGVLINYIDRGNLSVAAVPIMGDLRLSPAAIGVALSAFFWTYLLFQIPAGYVVDRYGPKWSYGIAFLVWTLASAGMSLVHSLSQLISLRLVLGMSEAVAAPASLAYLKRNFAEKAQGLPTAIFLSGMMLGPALGVSLGGLLVERVGWRALFLVTGVAGLPWLWPWLRLAPRRLGHAANLTSAESGVQPHHPWRRLLFNPVALGLGLSALFYGYFWYFCLSWMPSYLIMSRGLSYPKMGTLMAVPLVTMAMSCMAFGRLADWLASRREPLRIRKLFVFAGFILCSSILFINVARSPAQLRAVLLFSLTAVGLAGANYWAITEIVSPATLIGRIVGYQNAIAQLGGVCAPIVTGLLVGHSHDFQLSIGIAGLCPPLAAVAILALVRQRGVEQFHASALP